MVEMDWRRFIREKFVEWGDIMKLFLLALVAIVVSALSGCASTNYAKINAYGVHAITPYGIISMGVLSYERETEGRQHTDTQKAKE